jgi:hypothetical protein
MKYQFKEANGIKEMKSKWHTAADDRVRAQKRARPGASQ